MELRIVNSANRDAQDEQERRRESLHNTSSAENTRPVDSKSANAVLLETW